MIAIVPEDASTLDGEEAGLTVALEPERVRRIIHVDMDAQGGIVALLHRAKNCATSDLANACR